MLATSIFRAFTEARAYMRAVGDFGQLMGAVQAEDGLLMAETNGFAMTCRYTCDENGVIFRSDSVKNVSEGDLKISALKSRFVFDGGEYEVYTQFNTWQKESIGRWQPLSTGVVSACSSPCTTWNATPMMVVWNKQQNRGAVLHLLPNCGWEMKVSKIGTGEQFTKVLVELGPLYDDMDLRLTPSETVQLPQILCYETQNRVDFDCWKLHHYMHSHYPLKSIPFIYNTWMYRYIDCTVDQLKKQAVLAAEMGLEYFVVDAGWFGKGGAWHSHVGDWQENKTGGLFGRMKELADYVRSLGMKFGLWVEPERAGMESDIVHERPGDFIREGNNFFVDFTNPEAFDCLFDTVCGLVEEYGIEFFKFDTNANIYYDIRRKSHLQYFRDHSRFIAKLRERYPNLYITGCCGGGEKMDLANYTEFDSFWPSDNESPRANMRIFKETILRLPPQCIEAWTCIHSMENYAEHYKPFRDYGGEERIIACGDAWWRDLHSVNRNYLKAYHTAVPVGFSCDLTELSPELRAHFKEELAKRKAEREFWKSAVVRILSDTPTVTVYQYSDVGRKKNVIQIVTGEQLQDSICVYPDLCPEKIYLVNGAEERTGAEILREGIRVEIRVWNDMTEITVEEK